MSDALFDRREFMALCARGHRSYVTLSVPVDLDTDRVLVPCGAPHEGGKCKAPARVVQLPPPRSFEFPYPEEN